MSMLAGLPAGLTGLEQLHALLDAGVQPPIHRTLGIALVSAEEGYVVVEATPGEAHLNPAGIVQGGYAASVMDTACGCAVHSVLPPNTGFSTIELKVSYHRPLTTRTGRIRAEGRIVSVGRTAAFSEARLADEAGKLLATATSSLILIPLDRPDGKPS